MKLTQKFFDEAMHLYRRDYSEEYLSLGLDHTIDGNEISFYFFPFKEVRKRNVFVSINFDRISRKHIETSVSTFGVRTNDVLIGDITTKICDYVLLLSEHGYVCLE